MKSSESDHRRIEQKLEQRRLWARREKIRKLALAKLLKVKEWKPL